MKNSINNERIWLNYKRSKDIDYEEFDEGETGSLSPDLWDSLRFRIANNTERMVECTNHPQNISFGYRLHPPHLWDLRNGVLYRKDETGKFVIWKPYLEQNLVRFNKR